MMWRLQEDRLGRIWLGNVSNEIGYIKNGRYQTVIRDHQNFMYPLFMERYADGICMLNKGTLMSSSKEAACMSSNDSAPTFAAGTWECLLYSGQEL